MDAFCSLLCPTFDKERTVKKQLSGFGVWTRFGAERRWTRHLWICWPTERVFVVLLDKMEKHICTVDVLLSKTAYNFYILIKYKTVGTKLNESVKESIERMIHWLTTQNQNSLITSGETMNGYSTFFLVFVNAMCVWYVQICVCLFCVCVCVCVAMFEVFFFWKQTNARISI